MTKLERAEMEKKLKAMIKKSEAEICELEELTKPIAPENSLGRISRMDAINNKSVAEAALRNKRKKQANMRMALTKVNDADFGHCGLCKKPIRQARLIFMPESSRCVRCADRR